LLVFFGGYYCHPDFECEYTYNEIQVLDIEDMKWISEDDIKVEGELPNPRFSHTATLLSSNMYIFGGENVKSEKGINCHVNYNDIWVLNLEKVSGLRWEEIKPKGTPPLPRHGHTMTSLNNFLVIFGGEDDRKQRLNDVIVFDSEKREW
jgi:N-acetylneuraminic acid mutarotase